MSALPFSAALFSAPVLVVFNHVLDQAAWARQKLQPFAGRNVRIAMPPFSLVFSIARDGRLRRGDGVADLDIALPADTPLRALEGNAPAMKAAEIKGPADLADALGFVLQHLRWDIEADLAKAFGDVPAHRLSIVLGGIAHWHRQAARNLAENVSEYLVEESPSLVKPLEFDTFAEEVGGLHERLERLEAGIKRLARLT